MESISAKNKIINYDLKEFAGRIGENRFTFFRIIKVTISLSIFFALVMLLVR